MKLRFQTHGRKNADIEALADARRAIKNHSYQYIGRFDVAMYDFELVFQVVEGADYTASDLTNNGL